MKMLCLLLCIVFCPPPLGCGWVTCVCYLGNSSSASGCSDPGGTVGRSYSLGRRDFFSFVPALLLSMLTPVFYLLLLSLCLISFLLLSCASVRENTRA